MIFSPERPLKIVLVGVAGTSRDILLSVFALKSAVVSDPVLASLASVDVVHSPYILPQDVDRASRTIAEEILCQEPDIVGFSTYTWNFEVVTRSASLVRDADASVHIVFGGPEIAGGDVIAGRFDLLPADTLIVGEGERPLLGLLRRLCGIAAEGGAKPARTAAKVDGAFAGETLEEPSLDLVEDLGTLPSPYLSGAVPARLLALPGIQVSVETQRGCNFQCAYCLYHANYGGIRYREPQLVVSEVRRLHEQGVRHLRIADANFLSKKVHAARILQGLIDARVTMSLFVEVIPSYLDEELADLLGKYRGISPENEVLAGVGLQTTNEASLRAIRRRVPLRHFERAYDLLLSAGATIKTDVILGLPFETRESYYETREFVAERLRRGPAYLSIATLRLLPGTELAGISKSLGLTVKDDVEHFVHETPTLPRRDLVECMRVTTVAVRVLHTLEDNERMRLRDRYFAVHDSLDVTHGELLSALAVELLDHLRARAPNADYVQDDFPNAEHYWHFDVYRDMPFDVMDEKLTLLESRIGTPFMNRTHGRHV